MKLCKNGIKVLSKAEKLVIHQIYYKLFKIKEWNVQINNLNNSIKENSIHITFTIAELKKKILLFGLFNHVKNTMLMIFSMG